MLFRTSFSYLYPHLASLFIVCLLFVVRIQDIDFDLVSFLHIGKCSISYAMLTRQMFSDLYMKMTDRLDNLL